MLLAICQAGMPARLLELRVAERREEMLSAEKGAAGVVEGVTGVEGVAAGVEGVAAGVVLATSDVGPRRLSMRDLRDFISF